MFYSVVLTASKGVSLVQAGYVIYSEWQKTDRMYWEKINLITNSVFVALQSGDLIEDYLGMHQGRVITRILVHSATGTLDILRHLTDRWSRENPWVKSEMVKIGATGITRVGDIGNFVCQLCSTNKLSQFLFSLIASAGSIINGSSYFSSAQPVKTLPEAETKERHCESDEDWDLVDWQEETDEISFNILNPFICPITKKPIQIIVLPALSDEKLLQDNSLAIIWYESSAIRNWIKTLPEKAPPGWPVKKLPLPLKESYIVSNSRLQCVIDLKKDKKNI